MIPCSWKRATVALIVASSLVTLLCLRADACGPFFTDAIFVFEKHPDFPLERFAHGQIGVLQPTYARSYLVAAYRNLTGERLSDREVGALRALWEDRINLSYDYSSDDWIKKWNEARAKVTGMPAPPEINVYRNREKPHEYESYLNCQQDSFDNAVATLTDRIAHLGADSTRVRDWVAAQDAVFSNCGGGQNIPPVAPADQDVGARADRAYQIAAAHFYASQFDEAAKDFDSIARDDASPWQRVAPYLAARALLRKGSLADKEEEGKPALADAERRLVAITKSSELSRSHHAAGRLLNLTRLRLHPEEATRDLARAISKKDMANDFKQAVWDYTVLLDKFLGEEEVKSSAAPQAVRNDDLTDWIITFQDQSPEATEHALDQWQKTQSLPWLVSAISKADIVSGYANDLIIAAEAVPPASPAYPSAVVHSARLLSELNRADEARTLLDRTLATETANWPKSAVGLLRNQRMMLAQNLTEFLQSASREPAGFSDNSDGREVPMEEKEAAEVTHGAKLFFDTNATHIFNKMMPVAMFDEAAGSSVLPPNLRRDVTQAAFVRAALLDRGPIANKAAAKLANVYPELRELATAYQGATTPEARRFAATYMALKFPGLRPFVTAGIGRGTEVGEVDSYRDNWWCAEPPGMFGGTPEETTEKTALLTPPEFLRARETEAAKEYASLQGLGTAPNYLAKTVIDWATKNQADRRVPEALHLAVKATRFGCTDKDTGRWSKAAFDLLHRQYPNTSWAKETKYWFKG